jgi:hypothetical protein
MRPAGKVLEIACGTGLWTEAELRLRELGWGCVIRWDGSDWVCGEARLSRDGWSRDQPVS